MTVTFGMLAIFFCNTASARSLLSNSMRVTWLTMPAKSIAAYDVLAADGSLPVLLRDIARYRAAVLASGQIDAKALAARLEPLTAKPGSMTGLAQELLGLSAMQAGDYDQAGRLFDAITIDRTSPQSLRQRVEIYLGLIRGGPVQSSS